jgi:hypothetical protein
VSDISPARHCEEHSDAAIQTAGGEAGAWDSGLPRRPEAARNDGPRFTFTDIKGAAVQADDLPALKTAIAAAGLDPKGGIVAFYSDAADGWALEAVKAAFSAETGLRWFAHRSAARRGREVTGP